MNNDVKVICKEFQKEVFLYLNNELSIERLAFWKEHLLTCSDCTFELKSVIQLADTLSEKTLVDVENSTFNKMIEKAIIKKTWLHYVFGSRRRFDMNRSFYGKAALAGVLATAAIIISIITHQSIPVKTIPKNLLDWEGTNFSSQIDDIKTRMQMIDEDKWDKEIILLDQRLDNLEKGSDKFSFN
ncbi:MAG: zf-HC2 domain-containing protein [Ignavibacteriales bacterium]|nr:zf-HC2 domain-containing protein [Ignavibacteriales bacterium]